MTDPEPPTPPNLVNDPLLESYRETPEFREAAERLGRPEGASLGGLWGGALAFFLAAWDGSGRARGRPGALVITATQEEADELVEDLEVFLPARAALFPAWESLFTEDLPDGEICRARLSIVERAVRGRLEGIVVAPVQALIQPVPAADRLEGNRVHLETESEYEPRRLAELLARRGYRDVSLVEEPGEFSLRGDILDVFPYSSALPCRLEFFGETLESLREFDPSTQRSAKGSDAREMDLLLPSPSDLFQDCFRGEEVLLLDLLDGGTRVVIKERDAVEARARKIFRNVLEEEAADAASLFFDRLESRSPATVGELPVEEEEAARNLGFHTVERFRSADLEKVFEALRASFESRTRLRIYCENDAEARRFEELLRDHGLSGEERLEVRTGGLRAGFEVTALGVTVLTSRELFNRHLVQRPRKTRAIAGRPIESFLELERGDYVVHVTHGVGRYLGIEVLEKDGVEQEFLALEYRKGAKVYVPVSKIDLVQKYIGVGDRAPVLDRVGGLAWERKKKMVETALLDLASELLHVQALRQERPGLSYSEDSEWQRQFEASFPHQDTPDQVEITEAIKRDMQAARPMDRLICGDVGYGKTELAMRAAFKAVDGGRQAAVLVPTTVLAEQHYRTFRERTAEFPVTVEVLSRFRTPARQRRIIEQARSGAIDILIGTHRLLSRDVEFHDLGLLIIDEEQRFGVVHKERFKKMRSEVDVLTLSATPIPRTLHMALLGIRDISNLTTPPLGRAPIHTEITRFDRRKIREVIIRELNRDGQILFLHNRVKDIEVLEREIESVVPEARVDFAHGQMKERRLEEKMQRFIERETDLLIATTIVENGIDIPTANTIIINEADRYGLADLHQLRGRVGRSKHQAYCYLLLPDHRHVRPEARRRLQALVEFSGLGSGFQIAMRDLEIRGAGNILGKEQSGHIAAVGYDMFCRLLEKCVRRLKDEKPAEPASVEIDLAVGAFIPDEYLRGEARKLEVYRRISRLRDQEEIAEVAEELRDRFGPFPREVGRLLDVQRLRLLSMPYGVRYVGREGDVLLLRGDASMSRLLDTSPHRVSVVDAKTVAVALHARPRRHAPPVDDETLLDFMLDWMAKGRFPKIKTRQGLRASAATRK